MAHPRLSTVLLPALLALTVLPGCTRQPPSIQATAPAPSAPAREAAAPVIPVRPAATPRSPTETRADQAMPTPLPSPPEFTTVAAVRDIRFDFDKYQIRPDDARILDANAEWMKSNAGYLMLIAGHCDDRGTNEYNLALGERRAKAALEYLASRGVASSRMTVVSYGEERPLCRQLGEDCWRQNRRAQFLVKPQ
jgi:peptidoglycan-associated lipoprotein